MIKIGETVVVGIWYGAYPCLVVDKKSGEHGECYLLLQEYTGETYWADYEMVEVIDED